MNITNSTLMGVEGKRKIAAHVNCYDCKKEMKQGEEQRYVFKRPDGTLGDVIIVCEEHYNSRMMKEKNASTD